MKKRLVSAMLAAVMMTSICSIETLAADIEPSVTFKKYSTSSSKIEILVSVNGLEENLSTLQLWLDFESPDGMEYTSIEWLVDTEDESLTIVEPDVDSSNQKNQVRFAILSTENTIDLTESSDFCIITFSGSRGDQVTLNLADIEASFVQDQSLTGEYTSMTDVATITASIPKSTSSSSSSNTSSSDETVEDEVLTDTETEQVADVEQTEITEDISNTLQNVIADTNVYKTSGSGKVYIEYIPSSEQNTENLVLAMVDENGNIVFLDDSYYDDETQTIVANVDDEVTLVVIDAKNNVKLDDISTHWAKNDIQLMVASGLFNGTGNGSFEPETSITRGMFVTVLGRLAGINEDEFEGTAFSDVNSEMYYSSYIAWASQNGIVNGVGNDNFAPDEVITREQMAVILSNYLEFAGYSLEEINQGTTFSDSDNISSWAEQGVELIQKAGIMVGNTDNSFEPIDNATRAEASTVFKRFIDAIK